MFHDRGHLIASTSKSVGTFCKTKYSLVILELELSIGFLKNRNKAYLWVILVALNCYESLGQGTYNFTQFFFNPALLNPSFTGSDGRLAMYVSFRKQWVGIDGAPTIGNFSLQTALPNRVNIGFNASNDKNGLLSTSGVLFTGGYSLPVTEKNFFRFGFSIGAAWNKVDLNSLKFSTASDPVQASLLASNMQVMGNVGLSFHSPTLNIGVAVPNIFDPAYLSSESFSVSKVNPFGAIIAHASNRFYFAKDKNIFEPYLIYRYNQTGPSQVEAAAVLHLQNLIWFGGSYKQNYGISALAGFKLKGLTAIGYSFTVKNTGLNQLSAPSHEIHIGLVFGKKQKKIHVYSFVDTEKEKIHQKTPQQMAALKKKLDAENAVKKQEENVKQALTAKAIADEKAKQALALKAKDEEKNNQAIAAKAKDDERKRQELDIAAKVKEEERLKELAKIEENKKIIEPKKEVVKVVPSTTVVVKEEPKKVVKTDSVANVQKSHSGGPRLRSLDLRIVDVNEDSTYSAEQTYIKRLEEHAVAPNQMHGLENDAHPHAERHEFVKRGIHVDEMEIGDYIIAGVFRSTENAKHFSDGLVKLGFKISDFGYLTEKDLWYVYLGETNDIDMARTERDKYRKMTMFRDCWLLTVQK